MQTEKPAHSSEAYCIQHEAQFIQDLGSFSREGAALDRFELLAKYRIALHGRQTANFDIQQALDLVNAEMWALYSKDFEA